MNALSTLLYKFEINTNLMYEYQNKREDIFKEIVKRIQSEQNIPFIKFTDEDGYATFFDDTIGESENIYGIKVVDDKLFIYTDSNSYNEMDNYNDGWFDYSNYGEFSFSEVMSLIANKFNL